MYLLREKGSMFRMSRVHGKLQPDWIMPQGVDGGMEYVSWAVDSELMKVLEGRLRQ